MNFSGCETEMRVELAGPGTGFLVWNHDLQSHSKKKDQTVSTESFLQVSIDLFLRANWWQVFSHAKYTEFILFYY